MEEKEIKSLSIAFKQFKTGLLLRSFIASYQIKDWFNITFLKSRFKPIHKHIKYHLNTQRLLWNYPSYPYYQGYKRIALSGLRMTEDRMQEYNINNYLGKNDLVLDIGCNTGFLSLEISKYIKNIDALDKNPYLIRIADDVKDFLSISNVNFFATSFEGFQTNKKYNIIFSFASHESWDGNSVFDLNQYIQKMSSLLVSDGMLFFETHDIIEEDIKYIIEVIQKFFYIQSRRTIQSSNPLMPNRIFFVLKRIE